MGYNLYLHCDDCDETGFVSRGQEAVCIKKWAKRHSGHSSQCAIDNGLAEKWFVDLGDDETLYLPDELWPGLATEPRIRRERGHITQPSK